MQTHLRKTHSWRFLDWQTCNDRTGGRADGEHPADLLGILRSMVRRLCGPFMECVGAIGRGARCRLTSSPASERTKWGIGGGRGFTASIAPVACFGSAETLASKESKANKGCSRGALHALLAPSLAKSHLSCPSPQGLCSLCSQQAWRKRGGGLQTLPTFSTLLTLAAWLALR